MRQDSNTSVNNIPAVFTQGEHGAGHGRSTWLNHENYDLAGGSGSENSQQKHIGEIVIELRQLEVRLQYQNKQQMCLVKHSFVN
jgi:hypothetical protein